MEHHHRELQLHLKDKKKEREVTRPGRGRGSSLLLMRMMSYLVHLLMEKMTLIWHLILVLILRLNDVDVPMWRCDVVMLMHLWSYALAFMAVCLFDYLSGLNSYACLNLMDV